MRGENIPLHLNRDFPAGLEVDLKVSDRHYTHNIQRTPTTIMAEEKINSTFLKMHSIYCRLYIVRFCGYLCMEIEPKKEKKVLCIDLCKYFVIIVLPFQYIYYNGIHVIKHRATVIKRCVHTTNRIVGHLKLPMDSLTALDVSIPEL